MPVRPPISNPPFNVVRASHAELGVRQAAKDKSRHRHDVIGEALTLAPDP